MDLTAELKELRKQLYTYRYKSLELERQLRTHCHAFHQSIEERQAAASRTEPALPPQDAFQDSLPSCVSAFTNSLIMEIIASHLPVQDLLHCRLVCRLWAREMGQYLTKRKALVVAYEDCSEAKELLNKKRQGKFVNITTLCVLEIPITSTIITDIVENFGETLSGLKLDDCNPEPEELYTVLKSIPSLEVFSCKQTGIRRRTANGTGEGNANEVVSRLDGLTALCNALRMDSLKKLAWEEIQPVKHLERIIYMFPCLEELELLCLSKPDATQLNNLHWDSLKNLTISCDNNFSEEHFQALASLKLKLRKLTLHDIKADGRRHLRGLKTFLESISQTLCDLTLNGRGRIIRAGEINPNILLRRSGPFPIQFPNLKKLDIDWTLMTTFKTLDGMPQLEKFECKFQDWKGWWNLLNKNGVPKSHGSLKELSLGAIDSGCLTKITSCFGSVTKLDVTQDRIDDVAFRVICSTMPQLTHLRITTITNERNIKLKLTDCGFTGIPMEECEKLSSMPPNEVSTEYLQQIRQHAFIGNLRALYSLELACSEVDITDVAILYGIGALRRISNVTLPKCKLTNASLEVLGDLPGLLVLELHKSCGVTPEAATELRKRKKDLVFNLYTDLNSRIFS